MRRVVVTGMGIVSSIGNNCAEVLSSLRSGARVWCFVRSIERWAFGAGLQVFRPYVWKTSWIDVCVVLWGTPQATAM